MSRSATLGRTDPDGNGLRKHDRDHDTHGDQQTFRDANPHCLCTDATPSAPTNNDHLERWTGKLEGSHPE